MEKDLFWGCSEICERSKTGPMWFSEFLNRFPPCAKVSGTRHKNLGRFRNSMSKMKHNSWKIGSEKKNQKKMIFARLKKSQKKDDFFTTKKKSKRAARDLEISRSKFLKIIPNFFRNSPNPIKCASTAFGAICGPERVK